MIDTNKIIGDWKKVSKIHVFLSFPNHFKGSKWAEIETIPRDKVVVKDSDAMLDCQYKNYDVLEWYYQDNGPITNSTR